MTEKYQLTRNIQRKTSAYSRLITLEPPETQTHIVPSGFVNYFFVIMENAEDELHSVQRVHRDMLPAILGTDKETVEMLIKAPHNDLEILTEKAIAYDQLTVEKN